MTKGGKELLALALACALAVPARAAQAPEAWYASAEAYCQEIGLLTGADEGKFSPYLPVTQAMAVTALYRLAGEETGEDSSAPAAWAVQSGLIDGEFQPDETVSREELAVLLWRFWDSPVAEEDAAFADGADVSPEAVPAVNWVWAQGLMNGRPGNRFAPRETAVQAEAAVVFMRCGERLQGWHLSEGVLDILCGASGIAAAPDGSLLVTDLYNKQVWQVKDGVCTSFAGSETQADIYGQPQGGYKDGALNKCTFRAPWAIAPYRDGWAVSDADNKAVRLLSNQGAQTLQFGVTFQYPTGLAAGSDGELYISDTPAGAIYKMTAKGEVSTLAEGLSDPMGLCWADGTLYAAETGANRIIAIAGDGSVKTVAGSGEEGMADGPALEAQFAAPQGVTVGEDGELYVADTGNSALRRVLNGQTVTMVVRDKAAGEHTLFSPTGLLVKDGTLYMCDSFARNVFTVLENGR